MTKAKVEHNNREPVRDLSDTDIVGRIKEPNSKPCDGTAEWSVRLLSDEVNKKYAVEITFVRRDGSQGVSLISPSDRAETNKVRRILLGQNARLPDDPKAAMSFVQSLIQRTPNTPIIKTVKPGFRDKAQQFITPRRIYGSPVVRYVWDSADTGELPHAGSMAAYRTQVLEPIAQSPILSFGVLLAMAAPLLSYVSQRTGTRLISETAVFHLFGETTTGKTTTARVCASVFGHPDDMLDWKTTPRALEEGAHSSNDRVFCCDDMEKSELEDAELAKKMLVVGQRIPGGTAKVVANIAQGGLPRLDWSCFAISTGPVSTVELAKQAGRPRHGQLVRVFDIPVRTAAQGGVLCYGRLRGAHMAKQRRDAIKQIEKGISANYGVLEPRWIEALLKHDHTARVVDLANAFASQVAGESELAALRSASKFGVLYAAGVIATELGILPWKESWSLKAVKYVYNSSLKVRDPDQTTIKLAVSKLAAMATSFDESFVLYDPALKSPPQFPDHALGLQKLDASFNAKWMLESNSFAKIGVPDSLRDRFHRFLTDQKIIVPSSSKRGSVQIRVRSLSGEGEKRSFWVLDLDELMRFYVCE